MMKKTFTAAVFFSLLIFFTTNCLAYNTVLEKGDDFYINSTFKYTISVTDNVYIQKYPNNGNPDLVMSDSQSRLTATISCDTIEEDSIAAMREYIGDYSSSDMEIFNSVYQLKNSYFSALEYLYTNNFLYGAEDSSGIESNIKVFDRHYDNIFGVDSFVILYNTIDYSSYSVSENTYLNMVVPSYDNSAIYTLSFKAAKGSFDNYTIELVDKILKSIKIENLQYQSEVPKILSNRKAISQCNLGIYAGVDNGQFEYTAYTNKAMGYSIEYPSTFMPYRKNSFMDGLQYISYKIDPYTTFSIQAEKSGIENNYLFDKINSIILESGNKFLHFEPGVKNLEGKDSFYVDYQFETNNINHYITKVFIKNGGLLYTLKLSSLQTPPSEKVKSEFSRICNSLEIIPVIKEPVLQDFYMNWYKDSQKGYSFLFPNTWELNRNNGANTPYQPITLKNSALSSALEILIYEEELKHDLKYEDLIKLSVSPNEYSTEFFQHPYNHYSGLQNIQIAETISYKDRISKVERLVNYLDENDRQRFCYTISLIKGRKAYTMLIDISEYITSGGQDLDSSLIPTINDIVQSFSVE